MGAQTTLQRARLAPLRKSLGYHKYISRTRGKHGEWVYSYDEAPAPTNHRPLNLDDPEKKRSITSLLAGTRAVATSKDIFSLPKTEREHIEAEGYTYRYYSRMRPLASPTLAAEGIDGMTAGRHVFSKHPLGVRELYALELTPIGREEVGAAMVDLYHQLYGDGPIFLRAEKPTRRRPNAEDLEEGETDDQYRKRYEAWKANRRAAIIHVSTQGQGGYQATHLDSHGFSGHTEASHLAAMVGEEVYGGYSVPASPEDFDEQVGSDAFVQGEESNRRGHQQWEAARKQFHTEYAEKEAAEQAERAQKAAQKVEDDRKANEQARAEQKSAKQARAPKFGSESPKRANKKPAVADHDQTIMFSQGGAMNTHGVLRKARKDEISAGHKYRSRKKDSKSGKWVYNYDEPSSTHGTFMFELPQSEDPLMQELNDTWMGQYRAWTRNYDPGNPEDASRYERAKRLVSFIVRYEPKWEHVAPTRGDFEYGPYEITRRRADEIDNLTVSMSEAGISRFSRSKSGAVTDVLFKARKDEMSVGHKYRSRKKDPKNGKWVYTYDEPGMQQHDMFADGHQAGAHGELPKPAGVTRPAPAQPMRTYAQNRYEIGDRAKAVRLPAAEDERYDQRDRDVSGAYPFGDSPTHYTSKQVDQMVDLIEMWAEGGRGTKIRGDGISRSVRDWGLSFDLLGHGQVKDRYTDKVKDPEGLYIEGGFRRKPFGKDDTPDRNHMMFQPIGHLPPEALWRLVDKHILKGRDHAGYSITSESGWSKLNIWPKGRAAHSSRDVDDMMRALIRLQNYGYLYANFGGSVWSIEVTPKYKSGNKSMATVGDVLSKARKGEAVAGHKYEARTWDATAGHFVYHYRKGPGVHLTTDHIFEAMNRNKGADLGEVHRQFRLGKGEAAPEFQAHMGSRMRSKPAGYLAYCTSMSRRHAARS